MTKKEIALTLARQYTVLESEFHSYMDAMKEARENKEDEGEIQFCKRAWQQRKFGMDTLQATVKNLGISDKTWYDALTISYIENSKKEKETAS